MKRYKSIFKEGKTPPAHALSVYNIGIELEDHLGTHRNNADKAKELLKKKGIHFEAEASYSTAIWIRRDDADTIRDIFKRNNIGWDII